MAAVPIEDNPWIVRSKPHPTASISLLCFPHAGGSAAMFYDWPGLLPDTVEVVGLQLPGRGRRVREAPFDRIEPLVVSATKAVIPLMGRPYAIFGQSLGALMGFELARALVVEGFPPAHLFVSACSAPHLHAPDPPIHALPDAEFVAALQRFDGTPQEILQHDELLRQLMPTLRADFAISETYHFSGNALPCPITAFGSLEDQIVTAESLKGWREQTEARFDLFLFPGGHFYLHNSRVAVLQIVSEALGTAVR